MIALPRINPNCVRSARVRLGLSQAELAVLTGISQTVISAIETGKQSDVRGAQVFALANALGCKPLDFYKGAKRNGKRKAI